MILPPRQKLCSHLQLYFSCQPAPNPVALAKPLAPPGLSSTALLPAARSKYPKCYSCHLPLLSKPPAATSGHRKHPTFWSKPCTAHTFPATWPFPVPPLPCPSSSSIPPASSPNYVQVCSGHGAHSSQMPSEVGWKHVGFSRIALSSGSALQLTSCVTHDRLPNCLSVSLSRGGTITIHFAGC